MMISKDNDIYQAVVICEAFRNHFGPIGKRVAPCLIPLADKPILYYTLSALQVGGIQEVHLFCSTKSDQIRNFVKEYQTGLDDTPFKLTVHSAEHYFSIGEIIRDIFAKAIIRSDFVLLHGDTICNLPFKQLLKEHKKLKSTDKQCVMTLLYQRISPHHPARRKADEALIALDGKTNRLLFLELLQDQNPTFSRFNLDLSILKENSHSKIHYDLLDTHISLCTPAVVSLFADNFDYQTKKDFVKGIMNQEEILGNTIYVKVLKDSHYASRAYDPIGFDQVAQDMLKRWTYPMVPDLESDFSYNRHHIYKPLFSVVTIDASSSNVSIGSNTEVDPGCQISHSIIGSNCKIGRNVKMRNVYLMDNVQIEDNCQLEKCIIDRNVFLKLNTVIRGGSIIGENVVLGPFITIKEAKIWCKDSLDLESDLKLVGMEGKGVSFLESDTEDDEDDASVYELWGKKEDSESSSSEDCSGNISEIDDHGDTVDISKMAGDGSDEAKCYYAEVVDSLMRGIEDNIKSENLIVELNASKHAYNIQFKDVSSLVSRAFMDAIVMTSKVDNKPNTGKIKQTVTKLSPLIKNYLKDDMSKKECLKAMEEYTLSNYSPAMVGALVTLINTICSEDVLEEDIILDWYNSCEAVYSTVSDKDHEPKQQKSLRAETIVKKFIEWLEEAEEESE